MVTLNSFAEIFSHWCDADSTSIHALVVESQSGARLWNENVFENATSDGFKARGNSTIVTLSPGASGDTVSKNNGGWGGNITELSFGAGTLSATGYITYSGNSSGNDVTDDSSAATMSN